MRENCQLFSLCYFLCLQISFINTKSQLFTLKNNKIVMFNTNIEILDEIFYIISSTDDKKGNVWTKDSDTYEFAFDSMPEWVAIYFRSENISTNNVFSSFKPATIHGEPELQRSWSSWKEFKTIQRRAVRGPRLRETRELYLLRRSYGYYPPKET